VIIIIHDQQTQQGLVVAQKSEQHLYRARQLIDAGNDEDARMLLLELLKQAPDNQAALMMLGGSYFNADRLQEAEMVFERLILMAPGQGNFSIALFNTLWKQGRQDEAAEEIRRFMAAADKVAEKETIDQYVAITRQMAGDGL
jgi:predicted Zn-dependent protease